MTQRSLLVLAAALGAGTAACGESRRDPREPEPRCGGARALDALPAPESVWTHRSDSDGITYFAPRGADLDGDGKPEILVTGGRESSAYGEVVALDGATGRLWWQVPAERQIYASPAFIDVTGDGVKDVFAGGRNEVFAGIDGASGNVLWRFVDPRETPPYYFYNFHSAVPIADQTGDGIADLLVGNGGADGIEPFAPRPPGHLVVLDAVNGALVAAAFMPDKEETYMSPVLLPDDGARSPTILFGTGGETRTGRLWATSLDSVLAGELSGASLLLEGTQKGMVAPPALADLTGDGRLDIVIATFEGRLVAIDGASRAIAWEQRFEGTETYNSPALGFFDGDEVPDVFAVFLRGEFPSYSSALRVIASGRDGRLLWQGEAGDFALAGDVAVDLNGDGADEVIFNSNDGRAEDAVQQQLFLLDAAAGSARAWGDPLGASAAGSPWAGDVDADGCLDLIVPRHARDAAGDTAGITRFRVAAPVPRAIAWSGYLGTHFDSILAPR